MCTGDNSRPGNKSPSVFRRLAGESTFGGGSKDSDPDSRTVSREAGVQSEQTEIRVNTFSAVYVSGIQVSPGSGDSQTNGGEMGKSTTVHRSFPHSQISVGSDLAVLNRAVGVHRKVGSTGAIACSSNSTSPVGSVVPGESVSRCSNRGHTGDSTRTVMVEEQRLDNERSSSDKECTSVPGVLGRFRDRMGRTSGRYGSTGIMESRREQVPYQCLRNAGGDLCVVSFQRAVEGQVSSASDRQQDCDVLYQEAGRHQVSQFMDSDSNVIPVAQRVSNRPDMQAYCRRAQCSSRSIVEKEPDFASGMVLTPQDLGKDLGGVGSSFDRPFRNQVEQADDCVCVPGSRSGSMGGGRVEHLLGQHLRVCVPPNPDSGESDSEDSNIKVYNNSDSAGLGQTTLVRRPSGSSDRHSHRASLLGEDAETTKEGCVPPQSQDLSVSCVEVIARCNEEKGFSKQISLRMARAQKDSTLNVYQGKWNMFVKWCTEQDIDPFQVDAPIVAEFLCYLNDVKHLAASTIEGYRTAISRVIKAKTGADLGRNVELSSLLVNFSKDKVNKKSSVPNWNLALVLQGLTQAPFEPMHLADIKYVTLKTVFLIALASGRRRGELHALLAKIQRKEGWSEVTVFTDPSFVAKTQLSSRGGKPMSPLILKALSKDLPRDSMEDRSLCVVRALRYYLDRSKEFRKDQKKLFVAFKKGYTQEISKNTISSWIKKAIIKAYESTTEDHRRVSGIKAHDVRGVASSLALMKHASIDSILEACSWKNHSTFTRFYLKDLTRIQDDLLVLGPVVAALQLV